MIIISKAGNAKFKVKQWDLTAHRNPSRAQVVLLEEDFLVIKEVLTSNSEVLRQRFESDIANRTLITKEDRISSMEIWLRVFHNQITPDTYKVAIDEMWFLIAASENYLFKIGSLKTWFRDWYNQQDLSRLSSQELLFPCWRFDHAQGFLDATREAVYSVPGHIDEINPAKESLPRFHLPSPAIGILNVVKGRLRQILHAPIWKPADQLLDAQCSCHEKTLSGYIKALRDTKAWPFDPVWPREGVKDIFFKLDRFSYRPAPGACMECRKKYESIVKGAVVEARYYFDGLCLDCMERSTPKPESDDKDYLKDYWKNYVSDNTPIVGDWSRHCRIRHGEPTWYYSFMGPREHRETIVKYLRG